METHKIESLIEKYFEGNTSISEEKELKEYFLSDRVSSHLVQYHEIFEFYSNSKNERLSKEIKVPLKRKYNFKGLNIAASFVVISVIASFVYLQFDKQKHEDLGTFETPEEAFVETHKALQLVATNINSGMENVSYLEEYENTKKIIFK